MKRNYFNGFIFVAALCFFQISTGQTKQQKEKITRSYNKQQIQNLKGKFEQRVNTQKQRALQLARTNNWPITINKNNKYLELQKVSFNGKPIYYTTFNIDAARSTRADRLNSGGSLGLSLNGQDMTAHVWDGGLALTTHQEYDGPGGNNRFSIGDGSTAIHYHSAHVTGTIIASGVQANAKGMAPNASAIGYDWNNDISEAAEAASNGMLISNHSYGYATRDPDTNEPWLPDHFFGGYIEDSRDWDQLMFDAPNYLMVVAAGNDGDDNSANGAPLNGNSNFDKLTGHSTSKNNLVVANAQDANINGAGNLISVSINSSSSEGPTDDLRIKPDITGNGTEVISSIHRNNADYISLTGTSMASPNVAGTLLLLQEHANIINGSFMKAATLKGLALHTADDAGSVGPDAIFGWGLLNAQQAALTLTNNGAESIVEELALSNGSTYEITVEADNINDLIASISWTDPAGIATTNVNSSTPALVNDLDIRVTKGSTTSTPWKLTGITTNGTGDNIVDPFERIDVTNATGTYTITVTHKGSLSGGSQNFTLIVTGINDSDVAEPTCSDGIQNGDETGIDCGGSCEACDVASDCEGTVVSSFPYSESFEGNIGDWSQDTNDDIDWTVRSGGTPSNGTGPSSANDGNSYVYVEASNPNYPDIQAILNSPCFDLTDASEATFDFKYHMNGTNNLGSISLEASTDNSAWVTLWDETSDQPNSWQDVSVDLGAYTGEVVKLRFNRVTGNTWRADVAIDDVNLTTVDVVDPGECSNIQLSITFDNYPEETRWEILDNNGAIVFSGGTYGDQADGSTINLTGCVDNGCYDLVFYDSFGDGICCSFGNGTYSLTNTDTGTVLVNGGSFSDSETTEFCLGATNQSTFEYTTMGSDSRFSEIKIYPNPVKGDILNVTTNASKISYMITNMLGQKVAKGETTSKTVDVSQLSRGNYIINIKADEQVTTKQFIKE